MTQEQDRLVRPFYSTRRRYRDLQAAALGKQWQMHGRHDESWFSRWVEIDDLLCRRLPMPLVLWYALQSFASARTRPLLEFSVPEFVRAAEGVIALERTMGTKKFQERALRVVPSLQTDEYVGANIEALLADLYQLRSDCVHGKLPFRDMEARCDEGAEHAALLAYAAEVLAREALLVVLRHPDRLIFDSREAMERAWASGAFPPAAGGGCDVGVT